MINQQTIQQIENASLPDALSLVSEIFGNSVAFSSSLGQEDQVITDAIFRFQIPVSIFTIDTGRLFYQTYDLIGRTESRYHSKIRVFFPQSSSVEKLVAEKGINAFYDSVDNRKECCHVRKVEPLNRALQGIKVWVTGLRSAQSENRMQMRMMEWLPERNLYKFNPLINWSYDEVIDYLKKNNVPYNPLHDEGFISIGCAPCTRAIEAGEDPRSGRWWWETSKKECGLHN